MRIKILAGVVACALFGFAQAGHAQGTAQTNAMLNAADSVSVPAETKGHAADKGKRVKHAKGHRHHKAHKDAGVKKD